ncbi:MAG: hypothetical protein OEW18_08940 [Candidatus Aminicenantes bacterium]|nr:hypothetical protein [Candidatus Aminicenantes bacterium]
MRATKKRLLPPAVLVGLAAAIASGSVPASLELRPAQEKKDLWIVTATFRVETTTTLTDDWSITQKITPDRLVRANQVTIKKVWHRTTKTTNVASIVTIVENEGGDDALVIYERPPVSTTVIGHRTYSSDEERTEHVNQYTSEGSEFRTIQDSIPFRKGSVQMEYSPENQTFSAFAEGSGTRQDKKRIYKDRAWKDFSSTSEVTDGFGVGCTSEDPEAHISKQGPTYTFGYSKRTTKTDKIGTNGQQTTTVWKFLTATVKPYSKPEVRIIWTHDGNDEDITDQTVEAPAGAKILLKTKVVPETKTARDGQWSLQGSRSGGQNNYIKKFEASKTRGRVVDLESADFKAENLEFYWTGGESGDVRYRATVDDTSVSGRAGFTIRKPEVDVRVTAKPGSTFKDKLDKGAPLDPRECWVTSAYTSGDSAGLQYDGIEFLAEPKDQDIKGEFQWVQLIRSEESYYKDSSGGSARYTISDALDICYPHQAGPRAFDAPALIVPSEKDRADLVFMRKDQQSRSFLMFKPQGEASEWVPLYSVDWQWQGAVQYYEALKKWEIEASGTQGPGNPQPQKTDSYPEWEKNSGDDSKWIKTGGQTSPCSLSFGGSGLSIFRAFPGSEKDCLLSPKIVIETGGLTLSPPGRGNSRRSPSSST